MHSLKLHSAVTPLKWPSSTEHITTAWCGEAFDLVARCTRSQHCKVNNICLKQMYRAALSTERRQIGIWLVDKCSLMKNTRSTEEQVGIFACVVLFCFSVLIHCELIPTLIHPQPCCSQSEKSHWHFLDRVESPWGKSGPNISWFHKSLLEPQSIFCPQSQRKAWEPGLCCPGNTGSWAWWGRCRNAALKWHLDDENT